MAEEKGWWETELGPETEGGKSLSEATFGEIVIMILFLLAMLVGFVFLAFLRTYTKHML